MRNLKSSVFISHIKPVSCFVSGSICASVNNFVYDVVFNSVHQPVCSIVYRSFHHPVFSQLVAK